MAQFRIAGVQMDVALADIEKNVSNMIAHLETTAAAGARLTIFPECALTGYCFRSREEALPSAETIPGPSCERIAEACQRLNVYAIFGMLETAGDQLYNAAVLVGPAGVVASYRKIHLPHLGVDRFVDPGDRPFDVAEIEGMRVGMNICYDSAFPESSRIMSLAGADLIALPTNFPPGAEGMTDFVVNTRAMENNVYYACVNRVGSERGFHFIGNSKICDPVGGVMDEARGAEEKIIYAEIDVERARNKQLVRVPGKHTIHRFNDRRPEVYGSIADDA